LNDMNEDTAVPGFSQDEKRSLAGVLDVIIPPGGDGRRPGAGELGLADYVEERLRQMPGQLAEIARSLAALDDLARRRSSPGFAELPGDDRLEVLNEFAAAEPAFLPGLIFQTYTGYYQDPRVVAALGVESWPPHPEGYTVAAGDLSLLDEVRARGNPDRKD
jgi:hypothetical protein